MGGTSLQQLYGRMVPTAGGSRRRSSSCSRSGSSSGRRTRYIGQEANAVGVIDHLEPARDVVFSNHRCHGHYLAFTDDVDGLLGEVMERATGTCGGKGGSQHLCNGNFYSNGVQGSIVPVATGMAVAEKERGTGAVTVVFLGDGTLGQGTVYECRQPRLPLVAADPLRRREQPLRPDDAPAAGRRRVDPGSGAPLRDRVLAPTPPTCSRSGRRPGG